MKFKAVFKDINLNVDVELYPQIEKIFNFFIKSNLTQSNTDEDFQHKAKEFIDLNPQLDISKNLINFNFFKFPKTATPEFKNNFFLSIIKFFCYIKDAIISRDGIYNESDIVIKRQVNPDIEVYRYKTTTNLNMRYSKNSYALLFDK